MAGHEETQARGVRPTGEGVEPAPQHLPVYREQSSELDVCVSCGEPDASSGGGQPGARPVPGRIRAGRALGWGEAPDG